MQAPSSPGGRERASAPRPARVEPGPRRGAEEDGVAEARRHLDLAAIGLRRLQGDSDGVLWVHHERVQRDLAIVLQSLLDLQQLYEGAEPGNAG